MVLCFPPVLFVALLPQYDFARAPVVSVIRSNISYIALTEGIILRGSYAALYMVSGVGLKSSFGESLGPGICANTQNSSRTDQPTRIWGGVLGDPETRNPEPETPKSLK